MHPWVIMTKTGAATELLVAILYYYFITLGSSLARQGVSGTLQWSIAEDTLAFQFPQISCCYTRILQAASLLQLLGQ